MATLSKIAQFPKPVRDALNRKLDDGIYGPELLDWLNGLPEVKRILARRFNNIPVSSQNLSTWRETGFCEWQQAQEKIHHLRALSEHAVEMGEQASKLFRGGGAIAAGHIMTLLESLDIEEQEKLLTGENGGIQFTQLLDKLAKLTAAQTMQDRVGLQSKNQAMLEKRLTLEREKFEIQAAKAILKHAQSKEVQAIIGGKASNADKIAAIRARMFPRRPSEVQTDLTLNPTATATTTPPPTTP